jgi:hypothetical protein
MTSSWNRWLPLTAPSDRTVFSHIQQACLKKKELTSWIVVLPTPELLSALCSRLSSNANWERPKSPKNNRAFVPCTSILSGSSTTQSLCFLFPSSAAPTGVHELCHGMLCVPPCHGPFTFFQDAQSDTIRKYLLATASFAAVFDSIQGRIKPSGWAFSD